MSWFKDPELFMEYHNSEILVWRLRRKFGSPLEQKEFTSEGNVTDYLSLVDNSFEWEKSDFDALADFVYTNDILVNCQGLVLTLTYPRDRTTNNNDMCRAIRFWSHDVMNLSCYGLPVSSIPFREIQYMEGGCAPVQPSPKENELAAELSAEKAQKQALEEKVFELEAMISALKDDKKCIVGDRDRVEADKQALEQKVADLEARIATLSDELQNDKDVKKALITDLEGEEAVKESLEKEVSDLLREKTDEQCIINDLEKRVADLEATNATLNDELQRLKNEKNALIENCSVHEADKQALEKTVCDLEALNPTIHDELQREKDDKNDGDRVEADNRALEKRISHLKAANATLDDEPQREYDMNALIKYVEKQEDEKEALEKRVSDLEATNAILHEELQKERDDQNTLINDRVGEEPAGKQTINEVLNLAASRSLLDHFLRGEDDEALEKRVFDFQTSNASCENELQNEKDDKGTLIELQRDPDQVMAEKQALEKGCSDLEATNANFNDGLQTGKCGENTLIDDQDGQEADKLYLEKIVPHLEAVNSTLNSELQKEKDDRESITNDLDRVKAEKQVLEKKVSDLETMYATLSNELLSKRDDMIAILNDRDGNEAEKHALAKRVFDDCNAGEAEKQTLETKVSDLEATIYVHGGKSKKLNEDISVWINEVSELQEQLNQENKEKQALAIKVAALTSKLEKCTCSRGEESSPDKEPWMNDCTIPTSWVPYAELAQAFSRNADPLAITKVCDAAAFGEDSTTNIQANHFYRGLLKGRVYPVVAVNVEELVPNKEKARFDPAVWGLFDNAGTCYAARKPFESEM